MFRPTSYRRAELGDLVTVIQLKLPAFDPDDPRVETAAERFAAIEGEIRSWAIAKPIIAARRLRSDGTRGIRMGDVDDLHQHLATTADMSVIRDSLRERRITARAVHTFNGNRRGWNGILAAHGDSAPGAD